MFSSARVRIYSLSGFGRAEWWW